MKIIENFLLKSSISKSLFHSELINGFILDKHINSDPIKRGCLAHAKLENLSIEIEDKTIFKKFIKELKNELISTESEEIYQALSKILTKSWVSIENSKEKTSTIFNQILLTGDIQQDIAFFEKDKKMHGFALDHIFSQKKNYQKIQLLKKSLLSLNINEKALVLDHLLNHPANLLKTEEKYKFIFTTIKNKSELNLISHKFPNITDFIDLKSQDYIKEDTSSIQIIFWDKDVFERYINYQIGTYGHSNLSYDTILKNLVQLIKENNTSPFKNLVLLSGSNTEIIFKFEINDENNKKIINDSFNKLIEDSINYILEKKPKNNELGIYLNQKILQINLDIAQKSNKTDIEEKHKNRNKI